MKVRLEYGKSGLEVNVPDDRLVGVLRLPDVAGLPDPQAGVAEALLRPIGARALGEIAAGRRNACIVVCDITRPVPNELILGPVLETLKAAGIPPSNVTVLIATGTHRPCTAEEIEAMLGNNVAGNYRTVNHVSSDLESHRFLGASAAGTPVWLDRTYTDAELKITIGLIEPHLMAGFSGGRKLVMPGIAARETIHYWHSPRFLEHPSATNGVVEGNPVHEESLAIAKMCRQDFMIDVTLNEANQTTGVFAGDLEAAWMSGVEFARGCVRAKAPAADIVVTSSAGYPLDATFYQAIKGLIGAMPITKPGGSIVLAASCSEGVGSKIFAETLQSITDMGQFVTQIQQPGWTVIHDQWQIEELARVVDRHKIYCVCDGIPTSTLSQLFVTPATSVEEAIEMATADYGTSSTIAVIPKGPYVIPEVG